MYEIFGEFDSAEELNMCAEGLKIEGDSENLIKLAEENGIVAGVATAYFKGIMPELADIYEAAVGKLLIELKSDTDHIAPAQEIADYLIIRIYENEKLAKVIRKKGMSFEECTKIIGKKAEELARQNMAKDGKNAQCVNIPDLKVFQMAEEYYLKGEHDQ